MNAPLKMLRIGQVAERTGLARRTIYKLMSNREFPHPCQLSRQSAAWPEHEVDAWLQSKIAERDGKAA